MFRLFAPSWLILAVLALPAHGVDWTQFRGPNGLGLSDERKLPAEWSADENVVWRTKLPGLGTSSPITLGQSIYLTCYSGYAESIEEPKASDLPRAETLNIVQNEYCAAMGTHLG